MSLFQKSEETTGPVVFNEKEAVIAVMFLAVTADGIIDKREEELVIATSNRMSLLRILSIDGFNEVVYKVRDGVEASGRDAVLAEAVSKVPADLRETVYALSVDIVFVDAIASPAEVECLRQLQERLGVPDDLATKIVEVMRIKNKG